MADDKKEDRRIDVLGIKPLAEAIGHATTKSIDGIGAVLARICLPAAEEFGLGLKDRVSQWRARNLEQTFAAAQAQIDQIPKTERIEVHPRLVNEIIEGASWTDDAALQSMWAGLLTSSCSTDGTNQANLLLIRLVGQLTPSQAKLLMLAVERTPKERYDGGWIGPSMRSSLKIRVPVDELKQVSGTQDVHEIDLQLDHLRALGLIGGGFDQQSTEADMTATAMAMQLYARAKGWRGSIEDFYGLKKT